MYRILVCDDEEEIVSSLTACLTAEGYQVVTARTGWEVLNILSKQPIQLIKKQLDLTYADAADEFSEICSLTNPTVKRKLLLDFQ